MIYNISCKTSYISQVSDKYQISIRLNVERFCVYLYLQAKIVIFTNIKYHHEKEHDFSYILPTLDFCVEQILTEM